MRTMLNMLVAVLLSATVAFAQTEVTSGTPLKAGDKVQAKRGAKWYDAEVLEAQESGLVKVKFLDGVLKDTTLPRSYLRLPAGTTSAPAKAEDAAPPAGGATRRRTWTDATGKHTIEAEFVALEDGKVRLKKADGTIVAVGLDKLSAADQEYVQRLPKPVAESPFQLEPSAPPSAPATSGATPAARPKPPLAPADAAKPDHWSVQVDPPPELPAWPDKVTLAVPLPLGAERVIYPVTPSPFVVVFTGSAGTEAAQLWNLVTQKKVAQLQGSTERSSEVAVSPDGAYLATKAADPKYYSKLRVWSFPTGQVERELECDEPLIHLQTVHFLGPRRLLTQSMGATGGAFVKRFRVWDVTTGEKLLEMPAQDTWQASSLAISPGGRYLTALRANRSLAVFDLQTGKPAGEVPAATLVGDFHGAFQGCSFSPDGKLLALVFVQTNSRLVFLDMASGTIAEQLELAGKPPTASAYRGAAVEWIGDRAWCLFGGTVLDRATRRIVWHLDLPIGDRLTPRRTLPGGWVAVSGTGTKHQLGFLPIPWPKIEASLQALAADTQPLLKPGLAVSVNIRIEKLRFGTEADTKSRLADIFRERFRADEIEVQDDQPVVLNVAYAESEGATLHERRGLSGPPTGRTVQATNVAVKLALVTREGSRQLWSDELAYDPSLVTIRDQQVTDATTRDAILRQLLYQLSFTPIPYFVPRDKNLSLLPGSTKIEGPDLKPAGRKPATRDRSA